MNTIQIIPHWKMLLLVLLQYCFKKVLERTIPGGTDHTKSSGTFQGQLWGGKSSSRTDEEEHIEKKKMSSLWSRIWRVWERREWRSLSMFHCKLKPFPSVFPAPLLPSHTEGHLSPWVTVIKNKQTIPLKCLNLFFSTWDSFSGGNELSKEQELYPPS